ncbi:hypothetical protein [Thalassotalea aquiviva]|uniref:hypothetical protein n=1 Tax=Thalassotalea aquiviva TaxID=3242415 RepID=UPI003529FE89
MSIVELKRILESLIPKQNIICIEVITTGQSHFCFKVECRDTTLFVKAYKRDTPNLSSVFYNALQCQTLAAQNGVSARVLHSCDQQFVMISEFIDGVSLGQSNLNNANKLSILALALAQTHQLPISSLTNVVRVDIVDSVYQAIRQSPIQANTKQLLQDKLDNLAKPWAQGIKKSVVTEGQLPQNIGLIHGDLNFNNLLLNPDMCNISLANTTKGLAQATHSKVTTTLSSGYIIDWDWACLGPIEYDIAMACSINRLSTLEQSQLLAVYQKYSVNPYHINTSVVTRYLVVAHIVNFLWYLGESNTLSVKTQKHCLHYYAKCLDLPNFSL